MHLGLPPKAHFADEIPSNLFTLLLVSDKDECLFWGCVGCSFLHFYTGNLFSHPPSCQGSSHCILKIYTDQFSFLKKKSMFIFFSTKTFSSQLKKYGQLPMVSACLCNRAFNFSSSPSKSLTPKSPPKGPSTPWIRFWGVSRGL